MSHDGKGLSALYDRDSMKNNSEGRNSELSSGKRSRFDEVGELGRDSRSTSGNVSTTASASRDDYRGDRERSDRSRDYDRIGRDSRDSRDSRDNRDSRDSRYRERDRDYRSSRDSTEVKVEVLDRSRDTTRDSSSRDYNRDYSTRDSRRDSSRDGEDYGSGGKRVREDRDYDNHRSRYRDDHNRNSYNDRYRNDRGRNNVEIPFDKFLKLSPWRGPVTPLEERVKHLKNWDAAPSGFERISADKAKLTGLFPPPGNIAKTSNYVPPTLDPARAAMFQMLNRDSGSSLASTENNNSSLPANLAKQARRFYIGNLPYDFTETSLMNFLESNLRGLSGRSGPGDSGVVSINVSTDRTYAFVECKTSEDASMAMSLDGVLYEGTQLKIRRPKEYHMALTSGQLNAVNTVSNTSADNTATPASSGVVNPSQLIISGIPEILTADHVKSLLLLVTDLRSFLLLKDRETDKSLGVAIFDFVEDAEGVEWSGPFLKHCKGSLFMGPFEMKIQRIATLMDTTASDIDRDSEHLRNLLSVYNLQPGHATALTSTTVLQLLNIVTRESLSADYDAILQDLKQELEKHSSADCSIDLVIPKPEGSELVPGVGKVFAKFGSVEGAARAASELAGRIFDGRTCIVSFYPEEKFAKRLF